MQVLSSNGIVLPIMYIEPKPIGMNPLSDTDRLPIWRVTSGDTWELDVRIAPRDAVVPLTPANSKVEFILAEDRFDPRQIWIGSWADGITPVDGCPGLVTVAVPGEMTNRLRRGAYAFAVAVSDSLGNNRHTILSGTVMVEYEPTSEQHDIPYKNAQEPPYGS